MSELKPCPFCNSTNIGTFDKVIWCVDCYAEGPSGRDEERCVTLWNTRAPDPAVTALQAEVARLRAGLTAIWDDTYPRSHQLNGQCKHGQHTHEQCEECIWDYAHSILNPKD